MSDERARVALLDAIFATDVVDPGLALGIGDDCAALTSIEGALVVSVDVMVEGVHFRRAWLTLEDLGYRATMGALSDLAAMGARPRGVLSSLALPASIDDDGLRAIAEGQAEACRVSGTRVIGGNLARAGELSITTTVLGDTPRALRRDAAQVGDEIWIAGPLGLAGAGLAALLAGLAEEEGVLGPALAAWRRPQARIAEGRRVAAIAHAAIDVSDGLALDLHRLAEASGVGMRLEGEALRTAPLVAASRRLADGADEVAVRAKARAFALHGGEDYALVVTVPDGAAPVAGFRRIGRCVAPSARPLVVAEGDEELTVEPRGWDHFSAAGA